MHHGVRIFAGSLPGDVFRSDGVRRRSQPDGVEDPHERSRGGERAEQGSAGSPVCEQILEQIGAPEGFGDRALCRGNGQLILGVVEHGGSLRAVKRDAGARLLRGTQGERECHHRTGCCTHPDGGGVVTLDIVRPVQVRLDGSHVGGLLCTGHAQGSRNRVGERIGGHAVDHVHSIQRPLSRPPGAREVAPGPHPGPGRADSPDRAQRSRCHEIVEPVQRRRAQALEPGLHGNAGFVGSSEKQFVLLHRRHRRFLDVHIRAGRDRRMGERGVGLDGGSNDDDVGRHPRREKILEICEHADPVTQRPVPGRTGVRYGNKPCSAAVLQPAKVVEVPGTIAVDAHQGYTCSANRVLRARVIGGLFQGVVEAGCGVKHDRRFRSGMISLR